MFDNLSASISNVFRNITGRGRLTVDNIKDILQKIRISLLEADVSLIVVNELLARIKSNALNHAVNNNLTPEQEFLKIVKNELVLIMGEKNCTLNLQVVPPVVILMVGQQGAGKTTSVGKLGKFLREKYSKKILATSVDIYRPAAIQQLKILAEQAGIDFYSSEPNKKVINIAKDALQQAKIKFYDVLLVDTAGRLHTDDVMMQEIKQIHLAIQPIETLLVSDAMTGQDAVNIAKSFNTVLPLTGIVLTKVDSDTRGGAALSMSYITGQPIKFIGIGEKNEALEPFHPDRIASRILGMGDILSLIEAIENKVDREKAKKIASSLKKGNNFNLNDFLDHLQQLRNIGGVNGLIEKLPGIGGLPENVKSQMNDISLKRMEVIIESMTELERIHPEIIKGSRKRRIALGSGTLVKDVNQFLKQFNEMQAMMKKIQKGGMKNMMRNMKDLISPGAFTR
ncbi:signal recognition particle protein [Candidatus Erwinia haradaeae]|uniref:Signal recognition particle protein n=1 Tax=Candidatus Erwinia haradaeae TaxID=1922217 RepID=A0A451DIP6_9GAMM|nr:signal recognition particle protein [Candidatus Erwinia haradaeae]VFP86557.1 Signal recognition particle protein [Candidatus Erwinia haradaeae]